MSFFLFIVFVVYTMLPFSMRGAIFASAITCLSHTATLSICLATRVNELEPLVWQVRRRTLEVSIFLGGLIVLIKGTRQTI